MYYLNELKENDNINEIYLCRTKRMLLTKAGKPYDSLILQDKTGTIDAKIWDPGSPGIGDFDELDYVDVTGTVTSFQGKLQFNIRRIRRCKEGEYDPAQYLPISKRDNEEMYKELLALIDSVKNEKILALLKAFFKEDEAFIKSFRASSAAKAVHHGFVGGLLAGAILHDVGKTRELSLFPENDYTDEGQRVDHIVIGVEMIDEKLRDIPDFPKVLAGELRHMILSHHGEYEFGSPKKPGLIEAAALNFADNTDAKLEIFKELLETPGEGAWLGYQRMLDATVRRTEI